MEFGVSLIGEPRVSFRLGLSVSLNLATQKRRNLAEIHYYTLQLQI